MLFCSPEGCHLGAVGCTAEHGNKAHDQQFAKVVTRAVGPGIGDVVEGGEKDVHAGNGLQKGDPHPRIHPRQNSNTPQIRSIPKRDSTKDRAAIQTCDEPALVMVERFGTTELSRPA